MGYIITKPSTLSLQNSYRDDIYVLGDEEDYSKAYVMQRIVSSHFGGINI